MEVEVEQEIFDISIVSYIDKDTMIDYRPRSAGDNVLGSVRPSVRLSVRPCV